MFLVMETDAAKLRPKEVRRGLILSSLLRGRVRRENRVRLAQSGTSATRVGCCVRDSRSQRSSGMARVMREHSLSCHGRHLAGNCIRARLATSPHRRPDLVRMLGASLMSVSFRPKQCMSAYLALRSITRRPLKSKLPSSSPESSDGFVRRFSDEIRVFSLTLRRNSRYRGLG